MSAVRRRRSLNFHNFSDDLRVDEMVRAIWSIPTAAGGLALRTDATTRCHVFICVMRLAAIVAILTSGFFPAEAAPGPIRVSSNGRYFVDAKGEPFYFLADTQWELFRRYSPSEAKLILENRKAKGFTVVMVMLTGVGRWNGAEL
jgi:hypothetical protein